MGKPWENGGLPSGFIKHGWLEAMDHRFIGDCPIKTYMYEGFSIANGNQTWHLENPLEMEVSS